LGGDPSGSLLSFSSGLLDIISARIYREAGFFRVRFGRNPLFPKPSQFLQNSLILHDVPVVILNCLCFMKPTSQWEVQIEKYSEMHLIGLVSGWSANSIPAVHIILSATI